MIGSEFVELHAKGNEAKIIVRASQIEAIEQEVITNEEADHISVNIGTGSHVYFCGKHAQVIEDCDEVVNLIREAEM